MSKTALSIAGFLLAAVAAPPVSVTIFLVAGVLAPATLARPVPMADIPMTYMVATLMGIVPSLVFGGLTLLAMKAGIKAWPPRLWVMVAGGAAAAALYCVISTVVGFAPWGKWPLEDAPATLVIAACVLLSGAVAGAIYAPFAARG